jgi:hypothetical protein
VRQKLNTIEIAGKQVEVHASAHSMGAAFEMIFDGEVIGRGDTWEKARDKARAALAKKKVRVEVPFITRSGQHGVATGINSRTRKVTAKVNTTGRSASTQLEKYERVLSPQIVKDGKFEHLMELRQRERDLDREIHAIERQYEMRLGDVVEEAIEAALSESEDSERPTDRTDSPVRG